MLRYLPDILELVALALIFAGVWVLLGIGWALVALGVGIAVVAVQLGLNTPTGGRR